MTDTTALVIDLTLKLVAGLSVMGAIICWLLAGRVAMRWRQKHWSGDSVTTAESRQVHGRIQLLKILAGVGVAVAVVALIALTTYNAYHQG